MSAFGYKRTSRGQLANVRFTPKSGHSEVSSIYHAVGMFPAVSLLVVI
jgi:hypothetical protein